MSRIGSRQAKHQSVGGWRPATVPSLLVLVALWRTALSIWAAPGDLDPTFGTGGKVVTSFPGGLDTAEEILVQSDGKLVVAGSSGTDFALARFNTDGTLDPTFGVGGRVNTDFPNGQGGSANAAVLQPDGKIVLAGLATDPASTFAGAFALARYNTNGTLDPTFDGDGRVVTAFAGSSANVEAIALQADGKLVVAGTSTNNTTFASVFALARYNTDGSLDTTFDTDGRVTTDFPGLTFERGNAVAVQANGRIVAAGQGSGSFALARYNTDGSPDTSFDTDGRVTTAFGGTFETANALAIQSDGKIVAAGQTAKSVAAEDNFALARYNTDGSLDTNADADPLVSFDTDGKLTTDFGLVDSANAVVIQPDGRIVAAGVGGTIPAGSFFAVARYNTNGSLDTGFDTDGQVLTDFSGGRFALGALGVALQADGRIVATGDANASGNRDFGVARYTSSGQLDTTFDGDGKATLDFALDLEEISGLTAQPDGKLIAVGRVNLQVRIVATQDPNFKLARYNPNGSLDTTFGAAGIVTTDFPTFNDDLAHAVALQADGRIVVVGQTGAQFTQFGAGNTAFAITRYTATGSLDSTFGTGGRVITEFGGTTRDIARAVALQADGRIVVAGSAGADFALARYNTDGSLDSGGAGDSTPGDAFGTGGRVTTDFATSSDGASAVVIQATGRIVAAGFSANNFALAGYNADGSLNTTTFGSGGKVTTDFSGGPDGISALVSQSDGKLVAAGSTTPSGSTLSDFALARYNTDGTLDASGFGTGGKVTTDFGGGFDAANALVVQDTGKIVAAGLNFRAVAGAPPGPPISAFALARYNADGSLDGPFGTGGRLTTDFFGITAQANALIVQSDGRIVAGGAADTASSSDFAIARYVTSVAAVQFSAATYAVIENAGSFVVTVTRTGETAVPTSVSYATSNGTATAGADYTATSGTLTFATGQTSATFTLPILDDPLGEPAETVTLTLTNPTGGAALGTPSTAVLTITDNEVSFTISGRVHDLNGTGVAGVAVALTGARHSMATTDAEGRYAFTGLDTGVPYTVTPTKAGFAFAPANATFASLSSNQVADFVIRVGLFTRYFAEGATGAFFDTSLALLNATSDPAAVTVKYQRADGTVLTQSVSLPALTRTTLNPETVSGLENAEFSTVVESNVPVIADRTMRWNAQGYGTHAETSIAAPAIQWYLAEGATIGGFNLFYLIQNPNAIAAAVEVTYLLPTPAAPIVKTYSVGPNSRFNIWVNLEAPALAAAEVSAVLRSTNAVPIIVERAMYLNAGGLPFGAGHESAGVVAPALTWTLAEGATGSYFDLFVLIANPNATAATVDARYLLPDGTVVLKSYTVAPNSRFNIWVDLEGPQLADTAVSTTLTSTNGVPIVVERAMWWPGAPPTWQEGHNSPGALQSGTKWGLADGEVGGTFTTETYILIANTSASAGSARVTIYFEDGTSAAKTFPLNPTSRFNVAVAAEFPQAAGKRFGAIVESLGATPAQLVVERAMYSNAGAVIWAAGTNTLATRLQ